MPAPRNRMRATTTHGRRRTALVARIWKTADRQVREIEARLAEGKQKPTERERDARALAALVRTLRDLNTFDEKKSGATMDAEQNDERFVDIDEFRNELARRIHAFVDARTGGGVPGGTGSVVDAESDERLGKPRAQASDSAGGRE